MSSTLAVGFVCPTYWPAIWSKCTGEFSAKLSQNGWSMCTVTCAVVDWLVETARPRG